MAATRKSKQKRQIPALEWMSAAMGLLLTFAILGVIGWEALTAGKAHPPALEVTVEQVTPAADGYVVELALRNSSASTAAAVQVEGALMKGQQVVETSTASIDYVPGNAVRHVGLMFREEPARHRLQVRALGYAEP